MGYKLSRIFLLLLHTQGSQRQTKLTGFSLDVLLLTVPRQLCAAAQCFCAAASHTFDATMLFKLTI